MWPRTQHRAHNGHAHLNTRQEVKDTAHRRHQALGSHFSGEGEKIRLHCQGAIASTLGQKRPIRQAGWVQKVCRSLSAKRQQPEWVEGHVGHEFNEASDQYARLGTAPPPPRTALFSLRHCSAWRIHGSPPQSLDTRLVPKPYPPRLPPVVMEATKIPPLSVAPMAFWSAESLRVRTLCDLLAR